MLIPFKSTMPKVGEDTLIMPNVTLLGNVTVGKNCFLLPGVTLRSDRDDGSDPVVIGDNTNLQENVCVHVGVGCGAIIGSGCSVGHGAILHGCEVGDGTLVGMGAIVLNGAKVGKNCLIGSGALIPGGTEIPDEHLAVGVPVKVIRPLKPGELETVRAANAHYQGYKKGYEEAEK